MKKLKLQALDLGAKEILTREQLKNVLGGIALVDTTKPTCNTNDCSTTVDGNPVAGTCGSTKSGNSTLCYCSNGITSASVCYN
jgi:hypothetical protein